VSTGYDQLPIVVRIVPVVLAAGAVCAGAIPDRVAVAASLSDRGNRR